MRVRDITSAIEEFAPLSLQEDWDNSGLVVGSQDDEVHQVLFGFDCTPELIDEAEECGADMVVTHHPLIFRGIKRLDPADPTALAIIKAVRAGVAVYAAHTTADKVISGVSGAMAARLGLEDVRVLEDEGDGKGFGTIGNFPSPMSAGEAVAYVKEKFSLKVARCSRLVDGPVSKVAMCGGSGSSLIGAAVKAGAQLFITGDVSYHNFFTGKGFMIMDIGHFESEVDIVGILFSLIRKKFPNFAVRTSSRLAGSNPVLYL